ncbi:MAG: sulfatase-like hydrolase/transferase, partial [Gammaproteobacteria bacterium]|nr:sulfatase-like hydrolase/transferase [Gammaproteobacteria bacterium]
MMRNLIIGISLFIMTGCGGPPAGSAGPGTGTQPNVLLIMADDMGFTDIGAFGGEIPTPNLDALAAEGMRFSRLYTSYLCSPTRAMLLTGSDNHLAGLGAMAEFISENQVGLPGYEGYISPGVISMAELMRDAGYSTYMTG